MAKRPKVPLPPFRNTASPGSPRHPPSLFHPRHILTILQWELLGKTDESDTSVQVDFGLGPENLTVEARKQWPYDFGLIYSVVLGKTSLETKMLVRNEGGESFDFNVLFHTYLRVPVSHSPHMNYWGGD